MPTVAQPQPPRLPRIDHELALLEQIRVADRVQAWRALRERNRKTPA